MKNWKVLQSEKHEAQKEQGPHNEQEEMELALAISKSEFEDHQKKFQIEIKIEDETSHEATMVNANNGMKNSIRPGETYTHTDNLTLNFVPKNTTIILEIMLLLLE